MVAELIHSYTRAQAIEDGGLVDVTEQARETGFRFPVALTAGAWARCVELPTPEVPGQDVRGRLHDVLWMLLCGIRRASGGSVVTYKLYVRNTVRRAELVELKSVCGPGDDGEPVITIMLPEED